jgi:hypothetical protein
MCGLEEHWCYDCCTTRPAPHRTCTHHFHLMGLSAQAARVAAGLGPLPAQQAPPQLPLPAEDGALPHDEADAQPHSPTPPPLIDLTAISSLITAAVTAALQPQQAAMASLQAQMAELQSSRPPPPLPPAAPSRPASANRSAPSSPPPHRAVLAGEGAAVAVNSLIQNLMLGPHSGDAKYDDDDDVKEVRPQASTHPLPSTHAPSRTAPPPSARFNPLPAAMIPTEAGSVEDNTQLLTSLITTFRKREVKYASLKALDQGLEEWWESVSKSGTWSGRQLMSLANYRAFLIQELGPVYPHSKILEYHRLWTKAVNEGEVDMFRPDGLCVPHLFLKAGLLTVPKPSSTFNHARNIGKQSSTASEPGAAVPTPTGTRFRHPDSGKHPAGSCTKHPTSTTHTTAECKAA